MARDLSAGFAEELGSGHPIAQMMESYVRCEVVPDFAKDTPPPPGSWSGSWSDS
jgi:hypothetical protein